MSITRLAHPSIEGRLRPGGVLTGLRSVGSAGDILCQDKRNQWKHAGGRRNSLPLPLAYVLLLRRFKRLVLEVRPVSPRQPDRRVGRLR